MGDQARLQTFGYLRNVNDEDRTVDAVVSTGDIARDDAIIDQSGWVFDNYDRNPVVLWCHDDSQLPIAKALPQFRQVTENTLTERHQFATHPRAEEVWQAVKGGFVNALSVRWLPGKTEMKNINGRSILVFKSGHELLESSYVPIPADPGCLVTRADGKSLTHRDAHGRMVIDYTMNCGVRGCPNEGWDATYDVCKWHHDYFNSGDVPLPESADEEAAAKAITAATEARAARVATWAEKLRAANQSLKEKVA